jgi:aldehyde dehydrogenase (NAD+)
MSRSESAAENLIIDGERIAASNGATFDVDDPATGEVFACVARATVADVNLAVHSARRALESKAWRALRPVERGRILLRIASDIQRRGDELSDLESRDTGKPLRQARADVEIAARYFEFYAGAADKLFGTTIPLGPEYVDYTVREPIGVSAQIVPWNYPIQIGCRGIAPALAAGCTVVVKPAHEAMLSLMRVGEVALECGLPPGVLNVVPGFGAEAGAALAHHSDINQLTFTGSVEVGILVAKAAAENVVPVVMELGGKCPTIVFADADLDLALEGVANAIFQNAGQTCSAGSRLLVQGSIHRAFVDRLVERVRQMRVGPGRTDPDMGPIISRKQLETIEGYVERGVSEGATLLAGGERPDDPALANGYFLKPTLLDRVVPDMTVAREEIFGPVLSIMTFETAEEAADLANRSEYGLVAGVWTRNINNAMALSSLIKAGQIYVNTYGAAGGVELPFGGYKKSGYGREKGFEGLLSYTQIKNVCIKIGRP